LVAFERRFYDKDQQAREKWTQDCIETLK